MGERGRSRGRGETLYIEENAAEGVAHVVFCGHSAPSGLPQIRNQEFSDLGSGRKLLMLITH